MRVAGRLHARRGQGKAAFLDLDDRTGRMQLHARVDVLGEESLRALLDLDLGDLLGADGTVFRTRRGELSLKLDDWELLAKSLRPPPEKHHGLTDVETRFRHRELDLIANEEARELFTDARQGHHLDPPAARRAGASSRSRRRCSSRSTAAARRARSPPTTTRSTRDYYLRIATELYLKRLIVGGLERVYEIGKDFRNEGASFKHNPEFTMLEWYEAYADYDDVAERCEALVVARRRRRRVRRRARLHAALAPRDAAGRDRLAAPASTSSPTASSSRCARRSARPATRCPTRRRGRRWSTSC